MCNGCAGGNSDIAVYLIIVLILSAIMYKSLGMTPEVSALIGLGLTGLILYWQYSLKTAEHLETIQAVSDDMIQPDGIENYNTNDRKFSEYGNISMQRDIDSMEQRHIDLDLPKISSVNQALDNSDVVEDAIAKHSSNFQPDRANGFSSTNSAYLSNLTLGEPDPNGNRLQYTVPLNDFAYDLDESLSRGQQYRASINKRAIDGAVRSTRNVYQRFFKNELDENQSREWWSAESTKFETDFRPYY